MILKKYAICLSIIGILFGSAVFISSANNDITESKQEVDKSFNNLLTEDGIEHVKVTSLNGDYFEVFRDIKNKVDQTDSYDEFGTLVTRDITINNGANIISLGSEQGEYSAIQWNLPDDIVEENKEVIQKSMIQSFFLDDVKSGLEISWKKVLSDDDSLLKYSSKDGNVYVDKKTNNLVKREVFLNGSLYQTIDYDIINYKSRQSLDLFKINSPISSNNAKANLNLDNIKLKEINVGDEPDYPLNVNRVG